MPETNKNVEAKENSFHANQSRKFLVLVLHIYLSMKSITMLKLKRNAIAILTPHNIAHTFSIPLYIMHPAFSPFLTTSTP